MAEPRWTLDARKDLQDILDYIGNFSPLYAASLTSRIFEAVQRLSEFPRIGCVVPEFGVEELRELIVSDYRIVYLVEREPAVIVLIAHARQDIRRRLGNEPWTNVARRCA
jgi:addiction module RelE/StbE family toxin